MLALTGCTSDPNAKAVTRDVIEQLADVDEAAKTCMLEVVDGYSADELKSMGTDDANADFTSADPDLAGRSDAFAEFVEQLQACTDA